MRRGSTLVEMAAMIGISAMILASAFEGIAGLRRLAGGDPLTGTRAELACDLLRRDLAAGRASRDGGGLLVTGGSGRPGVRWQVEDGQLVRDGRLQMPVSAFTIAEADGRIAVAVTPVGLPARRIEGQP